MRVEMANVLQKGIAMSHYYDNADLGRFGKGDLGEYAPELWENFLKYYGSAFAEGELTDREKALIGLGCAAALECPYCIDAFTNSLISKGCDGNQIMEVFHVATAIHAGAALCHGTQALKIIEENEF